jgi:hypothetical protein
MRRCKTCGPEAMPPVIQGDEIIFRCMHCGAEEPSLEISVIHRTKPTAQDHRLFEGPEARIVSLVTHEYAHPRSIAGALGISTNSIRPHLVRLFCWGWLDRTLVNGVRHYALSPNALKLRAG